MNEIIQNFQTSKPEFNLLSEGEHNVRLIRYKVLDSFTQYSDEPKANEKPWSNPCPQLAITVVSSEEGKSGGLTHRLNFEGYPRFSELSDKQQKSGEFIDLEGYACTKDKQGNVIRPTDPDRTQSCANIVNQFAMALSVDEGANLLDALDSAIQDKVSMRVTVTNEPWDGKDQLRLNRFRQVAQAPVEADFED